MCIYMSSDKSCIKCLLRPTKTLTFDICESEL